MSRVLFKIVLRMLINSCLSDLCHSTYPGISKMAHKLLITMIPHAKDRKHWLQKTNRDPTMLEVVFGMQY